jgi:hypothetical protein
MHSLAKRSSQRALLLSLQGTTRIELAQISPSMAGATAGVYNIQQLHPHLQIERTQLLVQHGQLCGTGTAGDIGNHGLHNMCKLQGCCKVVPVQVTCQRRQQLMAPWPCN